MNKRHVALGMCLQGPRRPHKVRRTNQGKKEKGDIKGHNTPVTQQQQQHGGIVGEKERSALISYTARACTVVPGDYNLYNSSSNHNHNEATGHYTYTKQSRVPAPDSSALVRGGHDTGMILDRIMIPETTRCDAASQAGRQVSAGIIWSN